VTLLAQAGQYHLPAPLALRALPLGAESKGALASVWATTGKETAPEMRFVLRASGQVRDARSASDNAVAATFFAPLRAEQGVCNGRVTSQADPQRA
jgi:hypothetical protein